MCFMSKESHTEIVDFGYDQHIQPPPGLTVPMKHQDTTVTDAASEILWKEHGRKSRGSPEMFSTNAMRGEILRRSGMKQKKQRNTGKQTRGFRRQ